MHQLSPGPVPGLGNQMSYATISVRLIIREHLKRICFGPNDFHATFHSTRFGGDWHVFLGVLAPNTHGVHSQAYMDTLLSEKSVVVVSFHASWSAPCRKIAPHYSRLAAKHRSLTFVRVEISEDNIQLVAQKCRLIALPTFIIVKDEKEVSRTCGPDQKNLEDMIAKYAPKAETTDRDAEFAAGDESLLEFLDMRKVNCLNESQDHPLRSIVDLQTRNTSQAYLESDADEQLLITLPFNQAVKVRSVILHTKDPKFGPRKIKIDINKSTLGFDDVESAMEPAIIQVLEVPEEVVKQGRPIQLRFVRLQRVNSLHIFVETNHGNEDVTRIDAIDVYGRGYSEPTATAQITGLRDPIEVHQRGSELLELFQRQGGNENLSNAAALFRESMLLCPAGHVERAMLTADLAVALLTRYEQRGDYADLSEAITLLHETLDLRPPGHPHRLVSLTNLAAALIIRYKTEGSLLDLEEAIEKHREAANLCPTGRPGRPACLNNLTTALRYRHDRSGGISDLEEALEIQREAVDLCPIGHPYRAASLSNLAGVLETRYDRKGSLNDLEEAIEGHKQTLDLRPVGHPDRAISLNDLANVLQCRYEREGSLLDLEEAIERQRESLNLRPVGHPSRSTSLNNLAAALQTRYGCKGNLPDLEEAIERHRESLSLRPPGHPDRGTSLSHLATALQIRYKYDGRRLDLEEAIEKHREAVDLCPIDRPSRAETINSFMVALRIRYEREGNLSDLNEAIGIQRETVDLCPVGHPHRTTALSNLAGALQTRYEHEGILSDLEEAIEIQRESLNLCPVGHPSRGTSLHNLADGLQTRFRREGSLPDLEEAIERQRESLNLRPVGHPDRAISLSNLGSALQARHGCKGSLPDLEEAVERHRESLILRPVGHTDRGASLGNLATALQTRYRLAGSLSDLEEAIEKHRDSLNLQPVGHLGRAASLSNLAISLQSRYEREGSLPDLEEVIERHGESLNICSVGHPIRSSLLLALSCACLLMIEVRGGGSTTYDHRALVDKVVTMLREAVNHLNSPPMDRLKAALQWIEVSHSLAPELVLEAYNAALDRLDIVLATSGTLARKHSQLSSGELTRCRRLGVAAAACAVREGDMIKAVELLERGRNLLFTQIGRYRIDLEELQKEDLELAKRFSDLSSRLDSFVVSNSPTLAGRTAFEDPTAWYRRVASDWDRAVNDIRAVPEFENFLRSPQYIALRAAAAEGPIVITIPDSSQSHALIILEDHDMPYYVNLPKAGMDETVTLCKDFIAAVLSDDEDNADSHMTTFLRKLWVQVVGPIADALENKLRRPLHSRVWWCPSSDLSILPLHAAGRYAPNSDPTQNFPAKYKSSYTSTLQALSRARSQRRSSKDESMLIVAQPDTPGQGPLPNTIQEAGIVTSLARAKLKMKTTLLSSKEGTHSAVLDGMVNHSWIHLTCHGNQNLANPLHSCFCLYDKELTLHHIMQRGLPDAEFAFLAACHSSTGDLRLLDEGLHLAAGLQFAGFKSIVGTLWEVADIDGPVIAEAFYKALQPDGVGNGGIRSCGAAHALSKAVEALRSSGVPINRWIRYIHIGV